MADLIMRIVVEIEALSKELYKINGGPDVFDDENNPRELFFDTDCINYLNDIWGICNRDIIVSCISFNFTNEKNRILKPLKKANKRGSSSAKWNKAYQAVKHDRRNNLSKGNIENLICGLGALYILNIYYRDVVLNDKNDETFENFDNRFGSDIFAASSADASKASIGIDDSDNSIDNKERSKLDTALCIIKYTDDSWKEMHKELKEYNDRIKKELISEPQFIKKINEKMNNSSGDMNKIDFKSLYEEMQIEYIKQRPPIKLARLISSGKKEVVLNKGQVIYKEKSLEKNN